MTHENLEQPYFHLTAKLYKQEALYRRIAESHQRQARFKPGLSDEERREHEIRAEVMARCARDWLWVFDRACNELSDSQLNELWARLEPNDRAA